MMFALSPAIPWTTPGFKFNKQRVLFRVVFWAFLFSWGSSALADSPVMKTMAVHVVKVAPGKDSIDVDFKHPATNKFQRLTFYVDGQTGLSKIKSLDELRSGQVVSIDYVEGPQNRLLIRRIARIKLSGPPQGLENFHGL